LIQRNDSLALTEVLRFADQLLLHGHHQAVLALSSRALTDHGDWPGLRVRRARALLALHRTRDAERDLALALRLDPTSATVLRLLCESALCRGDLAQAEAYLDAALRLDPNDPRARELAGVALGWRAERAALAYGRRRRAA